jgi:hypothetical protein
MNGFTDVSVPAVPGLEVILSGPNRVAMKGTITVQDGGGLSNFFRTLHGRARDNKLAEIELDVTGLRFVNSSAIRLFVDWAVWVHADGAYKLRCRIDRRQTWQKTSFSALVAMVDDAIVVEEAS